MAYPVRTVRTPPHTQDQSPDATVAVGFLLAAFQPRLARAYTPIAVVGAGCLAATSGWDIAHHHVTLAHELTGHLATVPRPALLWALARLTRDHGARATGAPEARPNESRSSLTFLTSASATGHENRWSLCSTWRSFRHRSP